jgi:hypothetical protein
MSNVKQKDKEIAALLSERDHLLEFKAYVHRRLDEAHVPTHPDGPHSKKGCRIGDRLDLLIKMSDDAVTRAAKLESEKDLWMMHEDEYLLKISKLEERLEATQIAMESYRDHLIAVKKELSGTVVTHKECVTGDPDVDRIASLRRDLADAQTVLKAIKEQARLLIVELRYGQNRYARTDRELVNFMRDSEERTIETLSKMAAPVSLTEQVDNSTPKSAGLHPYRPGPENSVLGPRCADCGNSAGHELHAPRFGQEEKEDNGWVDVYTNNDKAVLEASEELKLSRPKPLGLPPSDHRGHPIKAGYRFGEDEPEAPSAAECTRIGGHLGERCCCHTKTCDRDRTPLTKACSCDYEGPLCPVCESKFKSASEALRASRDEVEKWKAVADANIQVAEQAADAANAEADEVARLREALSQLLCQLTEGRDLVAEGLLDRTKWLDGMRDTASAALTPKTGETE